MSDFESDQDRPMRRRSPRWVGAGVEIPVEVWQFALRSIGDHVVLLDEEFRVLACNRLPEHIPPEEVLGRRFTDFVIRGDRPQLRTALEAARSGAGESTTVVRGLHGFGAHLTYKVRVAATTIEQRPILVVWARDITAEESRQAQARRALERDRLILNATDDAVLCISAEGTLMEYWPAKEGHALLRAQLTPGRPLHESLPPDIAAEWSSHAREVIAKRRVHRFEFEYRGGVAPFFGRAVCRPFLDDEAILVVRDITAERQADLDRRDLEVRLQHAQKLESLGLLVSGIAHDFNNLLTGVIGHVELARLRLPAGSPVESYLAAVERTSTRMAELTGQMLAYSGQHDREDLVFSLPEAISEIGELLRVSLRKGVTLKARFGHDVPLIHGNPSQIRQVAMNLIINASDAMEEGGEIEVVIEKRQVSRDLLATAVCGTELEEGAYVALVVRDQGCGIDEQTMANIFNPFFTTKADGRGLGLSAVIGIIRSHGGALHIASRPGEGSTFTVLLPPSTVARPSEQSSDEPSTPRDLQDASVLLVDDDIVARSVVKRMLEQIGCTVTDAASGPEALALVDGNLNFDAAVIDVVMPGMSGSETVEALRRMGFNRPVLLSSGFVAHDGTGLAARGSGAAFLQKPFTLTQLEEALSQLIEGA